MSLATVTMPPHHSVGSVIDGITPYCTIYSSFNLALSLNGKGIVSVENRQVRVTPLLDSYLVTIILELAKAFEQVGEI